MHPPISSRFFLPALAVCVALLSVNACGEKTRPGPEDTEMSSADSGGVPGQGDLSKKSGGGSSGSLNRVLIRLLDEETDKPRPGAMVRLFFFPEVNPDLLAHQDGKTNLDGEALFEIPGAARLMARSEYSGENTEFTLDPEGETELTLRVRTVFEVSGRVVGPDGRGLEGADLFLARFTPMQGLMEKGAPLPGAGTDIEEYRRRFGYDMEVETKAGRDGLFTCEVKTCQTLIAAAYHEGLACTEWRLAPFSGTERRYDPVEMRLLPEARVRIKNYDAMDRPLGNTLIRVFETTASRCRRRDPAAILKPYSVFLTTGPDGSLEADLPAGLDLTFDNRLIYPAPPEGEALPDPVRSPHLQTVTLAPGEFRSLVALPYRTIRLHGAIKDEKGNRVEGARLDIPNNQIETGKDGGFSLLVPYNLHQRPRYEVAKEGFRKVEGTLPELAPGTMEHELTVTLVRDEDVTLVIGGEIGSAWVILPSDPAAKGVVSVTGCELLPDPEDLIQGARAGKGKLAFKGIPPGKVALMVQKGTVQYALIEDLMIEATEEHHREILLETLLDPAAFAEPGKGAIEGVVKVPEGMAPQSIQIQAMRNDSPLASQVNLNTRRLGFGRIVTSARPGDGRFSIQGVKGEEGLPPGRYVVTAILRDWDTRVDAYEEVELESGRAHVELAPASPDEMGSIVVSVKDRGGRPVEGISLFLLDPAESPLGRVGLGDPFSYSDREGVIRLEDLSPGRYVTALAWPDAGKPLFSARVLVEPGAASLMEVVLAREPR